MMNIVAESEGSQETSMDLKRELGVLNLSSKLGTSFGERLFCRSKALLLEMAKIKKEMFLNIIQALPF